MREELDRLLRETTLLTLAFAIAIGWSLYQLAHGVATFFDALATHLPGSSSGDLIAYSGQGGALTWIVGRRIVTLDGIVVGLLELAVTLALAAIVRARFRAIRG